jgi:hypothetical protein
MLDSETLQALSSRMTQSGMSPLKGRRSAPERLAPKAKTMLQRALKEGAIRNAERDRQLAAEWDHLSAEVWAQLDREEDE